MDYLNTGSWPQAVTRTFKEFGPADFSFGNDGPKDVPAYECASYLKQLGETEICETVYGGTLELRSCSTRFLPRFPAEYDKGYEFRLSTSTLVNQFRATVERLAGMVLGDGVKLNEDVLPEIVAHWENLDYAGTHGDLVASKAFQWAIRDGHCFLVVDAPPLPEAASLADQEAAGWRPYWSVREKCSAINFQSVNVGGREIPRLVTFREKTSEVPPGSRFTEVQVTRYRVYERVQDDAGVPFVIWELWREEKDPKDESKKRYIREKEGTIPIPEIPVVPVYANREGFFESRPPLLDLALLNIQHFQTRSDYHYQLHIAAVALLVLFGIPEDDLKKIEITPNGFLSLPADAKAEYLEITGSSVGAQRDAIHDLDAAMREAGIPIGEQKTKTATQAEQDHKGKTATLRDIALSFTDAIETALQFHALFMKADLGGSIALQSQFDAETPDGQTFIALTDARDKGLLDELTYLQRLAELRELPKDVTPEMVMGRLAKERASMPKPDHGPPSPVPQPAS